MTVGLSGAGFDIDLRNAQVHERSLAAILEDPTVELKTDLMCRVTGNIFVEFRQKGRPSGLATTEARYWAFQYDDGCFIMIPAERLRALARRAYQQRRVRLGGDFNRYEGVLIPIAWLVAPP